MYESSLRTTRRMRHVIDVRLLIVAYKRFWPVRGKRLGQGQKQGYLEVAVAVFAISSTHTIPLSLSLCEWVCVC